MCNGKKDYFCSPMRIVKTLAGSGKLIYNVCFCSRKHNAIAMLKHISTYRSEKEQDRSAQENWTPGKLKKYTDTFILIKKWFLVSLRGLQSMSNPDERPCTLDPNNNKLFFHKKLFMKRWNTQKCLYYSSHHNTYSTVKPGICGNKKEIRGIWGLRNYHRKSVVGG